MTPTTDPELLALEDVCRGRYALEREIGRGGMGVVVLARDLALDRPVAIKLLPPALARVPALRERFLREARTAAGLAHPNVVPVHAVEAHGDLVFFVMGYVDGESLARRVQRAGPLPAGEAARVLRDVAWALAYAHGRGVIHRDVKPDNILLDRGTGRALVTDFGIAQVADAAQALTLDGHVLGTALYMSPEQAAGEPLDGRSDLYALGAVGFFALTGAPPFEAPTAAALMARRLMEAAPAVGRRRAGLPPQLAQAVDRCLARDRADRFPSAEALAEALTEVRGAGPEVPPLVRNFLRTAEQSTMLLFIVSVVIGSTGGGRESRGLSAAFGLLAVVLSIGLDLGRRARGLLRAGYDAGDVIRGVLVDRDARDEEVALMYRHADPVAVGRRRTIGIAIGAAGFVGFVGLGTLGRAQPPGSAERLGWQVASFAALLVGVVAMTFLVNATPETERRAGRLSARLWGSAFTVYFFRLAGLGLGAARSAPATPTGESGAVTPVPPEVQARFADLPALLAAGEQAIVAHARRAERLEAVLVGAGGGDASAVPAGATTRAELLSRRLTLVGETRDALDQARRARAELVAARENVRIQLARIEAGLVEPAALTPDVLALRRALDGASGAPAGVAAPARDAQLADVATPV